MEHERPAELLRLRLVPGLVDELVKAGVRDRLRAHVKRIDADFTHRTLAVSGVALSVVSAHQEVSSLDERHSV